MRKSLLFFSVLAVLTAGRCTCPAVAAPDDRDERIRLLEERVQELEKKLGALLEREGEAEQSRLIQEAQAAATHTEEGAAPEQREFLEGGLALQKLNPEITFSTDLLGQVIFDDGKFYATETDRSRFQVREVCLNFQHQLDPYSTFKSALNFSREHGVDIEEVYITWSGIVPSFSFTAGRFRQNFGILNRWHGHDLDQTGYPAALGLVLGDGGLVGNGLMVKWMMPKLWAHANELTLEVVDGDNETLFSGQHFSIPSTLVHLKNYYDLSPSTYLELGLTGMLGFNNRRGVPDATGQLVDEPRRRTLAAGADLTLFWSPPEKAKYKSFTWRTEFYFVDKKMPDLPVVPPSQSWGIYSYVQHQLSPRWFVGVRGDIARPTHRLHNVTAWDLVPYVTFWQSEFVYLRMEYQYGRNLPFETADGIFTNRTDNRLLFQLNFAAGPHKHEKY
ncbi:MAG: hypothetical protein KA419_16510 [Acidobacteria bacterium]|nr:hypothetical protein [Acidobacteriota bacterium]